MKKIVFIVLLCLVACKCGKPREKKVIEYQQQCRTILMDDTYHLTSVSDGICVEKIEGYDLAYVIVENVVVRDNDLGIDLTLLMHVLSPNRNLVFLRSVRFK